MGTRSRIGIELSNDCIVSNGVKLVEHFNSYDKAAELIDGGDISALWTNAGWSNETLPEVGPLYYSSRGEDYAPRLDADLCEFLLPDNSEEYAYLFRNGEWVCYNMNRFNDNLPEIVEISVAAVTV